MSACKELLSFVGSADKLARKKYNHLLGNAQEQHVLVPDNDSPK